MYFWSKTDLSNYFTWVYISGIGPTAVEKKKHPGTDPDPTTPYTERDEWGIKKKKKRKPTSNNNKTLLGSSLQNRMLLCCCTGSTWRSIAASAFTPVSQYWRCKYYLAAQWNLYPGVLWGMLVMVSCCPRGTFQIWGLYSRDARHLLGRPEMKTVSSKDCPLCPFKR